MNTPIVLKFIIKKTIDNEEIQRYSVAHFSIEWWSIISMYWFPVNKWQHLVKGNTFPRLKIFSTCSPLKCSTVEIYVDFFVENFNSNIFSNGIKYAVLNTYSNCWDLCLFFVENVTNSQYYFNSNTFSNGNKFAVLNNFLSWFPLDCSKSQYFLHLLAPNLNTFSTDILNIQQLFNMLSIHLFNCWNLWLFLLRML